VCLPGPEGPGNPLNGLRARDYVADKVGEHVNTLLTSIASTLVNKLRFSGRKFGP